MPRRPRNAPGGLIYHALNRANGRATLFHKEGDYAAFERILEAAAERHPGVGVLGWCLMPNHWHLVLWPKKDGELTAFVRWLTLTHAARHHAHHHSTGRGHVYQGRFKSFPVQTDEHFLMLLRYVEANPLKAGLVEKAEAWQWGSLWRRLKGSKREREILADWPVERPAGWARIVNREPPEAEAARVKQSLERSRPLGDDAWTARTAARLGLGWTLRPRGRPPNEKRVK
jgi:putative transposase